MNTGSMNNGNWNAGTPTNLGWNNYGIWDNTTPVSGGNTNMNSGSTMNNGSTNNSAMTNGTTGNSNMNTGSTNASGNYNTSAGNQSAYGTPNATAPYSVQTNYSKEYPTAAGSGSTWTQYGDWFYTNYMANGRYTQIFYNQRGSGYSLALPVLNTYVPEYVVNGAVKKYGLNLYSITTLKSADGSEVYQFNLLDRGQSKMEWLDSTGGTALNIYRTEEMNDTMNAISTNAAMDAQGNMNTPVDANAASTNAASDTNMNGTMNNTGTKGKSNMKSKTKMKAEGTKTNGKMKTDSTSGGTSQSPTGNSPQNHKEQ
jgi:hypothetical protein